MGSAGVRDAVGVGGHGRVRGVEDLMLPRLYLWPGTLQAAPWALLWGGGSHCPGWGGGRGRAALQRACHGTA